MIGISNITKEGSIIGERTWDTEAIRTLCINNKLYTSGTNEDYEKMLNFVATAEEGPTYNNIYAVANDIVNHSDGQTIENVMFLIETKVIKTFFSISEEVQQSIDCYNCQFIGFDSSADGYCGCEDCVRYKSMVLDDYGCKVNCCKNYVEKKVEGCF